MGSAKAWYFAALGVVALSVGSSTGRGLFDKATSAVDQFRARTIPFVAMLEMTLRNPQSTPQVQQTMARVQEAAAQVQAQRACAEATAARIQALKGRIEARQAAQEEAAADQFDSMEAQFDVVPNVAWSKLATLPDQTLIAKKAVLANRALARVYARQVSRKFPAPNVTLTPNQVIIEGPNGVVVAPRPKIDGNIPVFPARPTDEATDPI